MDFQDLRPLIESTIKEVFDTMLALEIDSHDEWPTEGGTDDLVAGHTRFSGDISGHIQTWLPYSLGTIITAAMLGMEPEDIEDEDSVSDVLMEVLNIVSGNLKTNLTNSGVTIDFEAPRIMMEGRECALPATDTADTTRFALIHDTHPIRVQIAPIGAADTAPAEEPAATEAVEEANSDAPMTTEEIAALMAESPEPKPETTPEKPPPTDAPMTTEEIAALMAETPEPKPETTTEKAPPTDALPEPPAKPEAEPAAGGAEDKEKFDVTYQPAEEESLESQLKLAKIVAALNEDLDEDKEAPAEAKKVAEEEPDLQPDQLELIMDIPIRLTAELGRTRMRIEELLKLGPGASVILAELENEPITILANNTPIARGMVVVENEKYGIRITELTSRKDRLKSLT